MATSAYDKLCELIASSTAPSCVIWSGARIPYGYGAIRKDGKFRYAHHLALEISGSPWHPPLGNHALHSCDTPSCVAPWHLRWGTNARNRKDSVEQNKQARGFMLPQTKLKPEDFRAIRNIYARGELRQVDVAEQFGVTQSAVSRIVNFKKGGARHP